MSLKQWENNGWLKAHRSSAREISDLLKVADRDLDDCRLPGLSPDWRLGIAYNAALQSAAAALAVSGYRAARDAHHYRVIQSLAYTIGFQPEQILVLDRIRKKRNIGGYERTGAVSDKEATEAIELAQDLRRNVEDWILKEHPGIIDK